MLKSNSSLERKITKLMEYKYSVIKEDVDDILRFTMVIEVKQ